MILALIKIDERTKKAFLVLCALFILILLIFGLIYSLIARYLRPKAKKIDSYMFDLCKYQIVKTPKDFFEAVKYYEKRRVYETSRWFFRGVILLIVLILGYGFLFNDGNIKQLFLEGKNIFPIIKWQTIGDINKTLLEQNQPTIPGFDWMPVTLLPNIIMKDSLNPKDPNLYISLLIYLILIVLLFNISGCALTYFVRLKRGKLKSKEVFEKSLDNFNINNLNTPLSSTQPINNNLNQPIEIKKDDGN